MTVTHKYSKNGDGKQELNRKIFYEIYTINGKGNQPRIGVLIFFDENGELLSRFTTLRSPKDNNNKQLMRTVLENRAKNADEILKRPGFANHYLNIYYKEAYEDITQDEWKLKMKDGDREFLGIYDLKKIDLKSEKSPYEAQLIQSCLEKLKEQARIEAVPVKPVME